ncbi:hypothetical protein [uncultured Hoeflea sp.]|uniref:hypothetical protein n=1 Tax=uncultured Hoeflea sp. TaxID=538666 RepID=UPI00260B15F7|nr:hypothetical protein [uncultured Hoeflea sp.]
MDGMTLRKIEVMESTLRSNPEICHGIKVLTDTEAFRHGYRQGFDRALQPMTGHAWEMNDPAARISMP